MEKQADKHITLPPAVETAFGFTIFKVVPIAGAVITAFLLVGGSIETAGLLDFGLFR